MNHSNYIRKIFPHTRHNTKAITVWHIYIYIYAYIKLLLINIHSHQKPMSYSIILQNISRYRGILNNSNA